MFTVPQTHVHAMAGIWRDLTDMPVFAILVTDAIGEVKDKGVSTMPVILKADQYERWLCAKWNEARDLAVPYAGDLTSCV